MIAHLPAIHIPAPLDLEVRQQAFSCHATAKHTIDDPLEDWMGFLAFRRINLGLGARKAAIWKNW